ncbi:TSC22 domain family protein 2 [Synchiropus picturatus]
MSKMPAKKKSCFQITSVTQAQVAASSITEDTESLDDPDESRTEDVSSEIFDVSRAELGVCDRSSSEETLNNVGESQEIQAHLTGPVNGGPSYKSVGSSRVAAHNLGGSVSVPAATQPFVPSSVSHPLTSISTTPSASVTHTVPASTSCSSRFRVIKLDHSTGEPFRRGRWTCTEFYEKDSDSNVNRTIDSIKPTLIPNHNMDRDIGLGTTSNSVVTTSAFSSHSLEGTADSGYSVAHLSNAHPSESLHKGYSLVSHIGNGASAFQPTGYTDSSPQQGNMQPVASQNFLSNNVNGVHQGAMQQKSPMMPPVTQTHPFAYCTQPTGLATGQQDFRQQHFVSNTQNLPVTSHTAGPSSFVPSGSVSKTSMHHMGNASTIVPGHPGTGHQHPASPSQPSGGLTIAPTHSVATTSSHSGMPNVPATVPSTTNTTKGVPSQALGTGGNLQPQGAQGGLNTSLHAEDGRQKLDTLPQSSVVPGKDAVKPFITEGLNLPSPAVNSLFNIHIAMDGDEDSASGASVVAIDNKIEQAMDLVKSHLMYAVREEVEVLKEQIKELYERNSVLERENAVLKSLANSEQLNQLSSQLTTVSSTSSPQQQPPVTTNSAVPTVHHEGTQGVPHHPNITSA